ncbi:MAG: phasin family protein [Rhodothermales bacterium]
MAAKKKPTIRVSKKKTKTAKGKKKEKKDFFPFIELPDDLGERGRDIWLAGLGALSTVEKEGTRLFHSLVEKGEVWEKEGRKKLGAAKKKFDAAKEKVGTTVGEVAKKGKVPSGVDEKLFSTVEASVERALQRLGVPTRAEVKDLAGKVDALSGQVATLATVIEKGKGGAAASDGKTKKAVYHVVPRDEGWAIKEEGNTTPVAVYGTKGEATKQARSLAKTKAPSRLVLHRKDGSIQDSTSYQA